MSFVKQHWVVLVFVLALIVSPIYAHLDAKGQSDALRQANVERCIAAAPRAAYDIAFKYQAGDARAAAGNIVTGARYRALADAEINTVAAPKGMEGNKALVQVIYVPTNTKNKFIAKLTPRALDLQKEGCQQAFE